MKKGKAEKNQSPLCLMRKNMKMPCIQAGEPGPLGDRRFNSEAIGAVLFTESIA